MKRQESVTSLIEGLSLGGDADTDWKARLEKATNVSNTVC
jgi:hypothetical protein